MIEQKLQDEINIVMTTARNDGFEFVTVEHLLLALTNVDEIISLLNKNSVNIIQMQVDLEKYIQIHTPTLPENSDIEMVPTVGFERVLQRSVYQAILAKTGIATATDVLASVFSERGSHAVYLLKKNNISKVDTLKSKKPLDNPLNYYDLFENNNPYVEFHENGNKRVEISYKGEHMHGPFKCWYESGQIEEQATYVDNKLDGKYISWHENGIKAADEIYFKGELDSTSTHWYDNGQKKLEVDYLLGVVNGTYTRWHKNGTLDQQAFYVDGKIESFRGVNPDLFDGNSLTTVSDIFIKDGVAYKNTPYTGKFITEHKNGNTHIEGYYIDGLKEYTWTEFYDNHHKQECTNYQEGVKQGSSSKWSKYGESFGCYLNGKKDGLWHEYIGNRKKPKKILYANGVRQLTRYPLINILTNIATPLAIIIYFFYQFTG